MGYQATLNSLRFLPQWLTQIRTVTNFNTPHSSTGSNQACHAGVLCVHFTFFFFVVDTPARPSAGFGINKVRAQQPLYTGWVVQQEITPYNPNNAKTSKYEHVL
jgi:hypothetical protein